MNRAMGVKNRPSTLEKRRVVFAPLNPLPPTIQRHTIWVWPSFLPGTLLVDLLGS